MSSRGLPGRRPLQQGGQNGMSLAGIACCCFITGIVSHVGLLTVLPPANGPSSPASRTGPRERVMLSQIDNLQRQLAQRNTEILELRATAPQPLFKVLSVESQKVDAVAAPPVDLLEVLPPHKSDAAPQEPGETYNLGGRPHFTDLSTVGAASQTETSVGSSAGTLSSPNGCEFQGPLPGYLPECSRDPCDIFRSVEAALTACSVQASCGGVTYTGPASSSFELRSGFKPLSSPDGETSYLRRCSGGPADAPPKAEAFATDGTWSHGNVEAKAGLVVVHQKDPLPPWYEPSSDGFVGEDALDDIGSFVEGLPTIYLKVASYRDELCHMSITDAFNRANHPERIFVGVVEQNAQGDVPCLQVDGHRPDWTCPDDPLAPQPTLCRWASHIRLYKQHAKDATGPTFARHVGDRMYRGEYFVLQTDAHMSFVQGWDDDVVGQFDATSNLNAVLTTYPTEVNGALDANFHSKHHTSPVMCATGFTSEGLLRHGSAIEIWPMFGKSPVLEPFWAAGFSFARGHFALRVPYDCCTPMMFQGEEIDIAVRAWTQGYDIYTPHNSVAFHPYSRKSKPPMFWENANAHKGEGMRSARRVQGLIKIGSPPESSYDTTGSSMYGVGIKRSADDFYDLFGIDRMFFSFQLSAQSLCIKPICVKHHPSPLRLFFSK